MPRTLSGALSVALDDTITQPYYLARIDWAAGTVRLSSGPTVSYDGISYDGGSLSVGQVRDLQGGAREAQISLANTDDAAAALALGEDISTVAVRLWVAYGPGPHASGEPELVFLGYVDSAEITPLRVTLGLVSDARRRMYGPRLLIAPPLCNHLPPRGTILVWGGERYELKGQE